MILFQSFSPFHLGHTSSYLIFFYIYFCIQMLWTYETFNVKSHRSIKKFNENWCIKYCTFKCFSVCKKSDNFSVYLQMKEFYLKSTNSSNYRVPFWLEKFLCLQIRSINWRKKITGLQVFTVIIWSIMIGSNWYWCRHSCESRSFSFDKRDKVWKKPLALGSGK